MDSFENLKTKHTLSGVVSRSAMIDFRVFAFVGKASGHYVQHGSNCTVESISESEARWTVTPVVLREDTQVVTVVAVPKNFEQKSVGATRSLQLSIPPFALFSQFH